MLSRDAQIMRVGVLFGYFLFFLGVFLVLVGGSLFQCVEKPASSQSVSRSAKCFRSVNVSLRHPASQQAVSQSVSQSVKCQPAVSQSVSQQASQPATNQPARHSGQSSSSVLHTTRIALEVNSLNP